nr:PREDICTED: ABC transporter C family member 3-like [Daucus carota subsp. sativus]
MIVFLALVADVADAKMISNGALKGDGTICNRPGGCMEPDTPANPYNRVSKALSWLAISVYLFTQVQDLSDVKYPLLLRVWWCVFFSASCYCLVIDYVYYNISQPLPLHFVISDALDIVIGLFLCLVGFSGYIKPTENGIFQEPLLSADISRVPDGEECKKSRGGETVTPYASANIFSLLTFSWIGSLVALGYRKTLDIEDVPRLASIDSVKGAFPLLKDKCGGDNSSLTTLKLAKALFYSMWRDILLTAFLAMINTVASYGGPYLIDSFVQYLNGSKNLKEGYLLVSAFVISKLIECLTQRHWFFKVQQNGTRGKAALIALIYHKGLTLSCQSKQGHTSGEMTNIMTVDAERIGVLAGTCMIYGWSSLKLENYQTKLMESKDHRMKATSEILKNMRILKLQGWEMRFLSEILDLRKIEAGWLKKFVYTNAVVTFVFWGTPTFVAVVTFSTCMILRIPLESGKVWSALATFRILQEPIYNLPDTISVMIQTKVSLDRIAAYPKKNEICMEPAIRSCIVVVQTVAIYKNAS